MASDVFVSHSIKDKAIAEAIVARLEADSVTCWIAPRDVVPGADWGESIIDAIESSRIMVLIFSRNADASPQIKREVERAVNKGFTSFHFALMTSRLQSRWNISSRLRSGWTPSRRRWNGIWTTWRKRSRPC